MLESKFCNHEIKWVTNARTTRVEEDKLHTTELDAHGNEVKQHEIPFKFAMMLPAFKGMDAVANVEGLCNPRGFVLIDARQRSKKHPTSSPPGSASPSRRSRSRRCRPARPRPVT